MLKVHTTTTGGLFPCNCKGLVGVITWAEGELSQPPLRRIIFGKGGKFVNGALTDGIVNVIFIRVSEDQEGLQDCKEFFGVIVWWSDELSQPTP